MRGHILYAHDHRDRAIALAQAIGGTAGPVDEIPSVKFGLDTIIFWGHGTIAKMCDKTPTEMASTVKAWKKLNDKLNTIEIITCNARHHSRDRVPYVSSLKSALSSGILNATRNITVKALPANVGGTLNNFSILLADVASKSYCYVTANGVKSTKVGEGFRDDILTAASNQVKAASKTFAYDLAQGASSVTKSDAYKTGEFTLNFGYFNTLRNQLVKV